MNGKFFLGFVSLLVIIFGTLCWADTDGVWHEAEDVRGGTFGFDEQDVTTGYTFVNPVTINTAGGRGLYSTSSVDDGIAGVTSAAGKSAIYGWANNPASYSGYFEGGKFVIANGNVGIGTVTPTAKLEIDGSNPQISINGNGHSEIILNRASTTFQSILNFKTSGIYDWSILTDNTASPMLRFVSNGIQNRLVISQAGNVGIGTSSPTTLLDVNSGMYPGPLVKIQGNWDTTYLSVIRNGKNLVDIGSGGGGPGYGSGAISLNYYTPNLDNSIFLSANPGSASYIDAGNVGIGTTAPTEKLDVDGNVRIRGRSSCAKLYTDASGNVLCGADAADTDWVEAAGNVYRLSGNIGIGTATPVSKLHVYTPSASSRITVQSGAQKLIMQAYDPMNAFVGTETLSRLLIGVGATGDIFVETNGNVGIGMMGTEKLAVNGRIKANRFVGENSLVLNDFQTVQPASNVYLYSPPNDRDSWLYLDSADPGSNWGIYHRQIDAGVKGLPANSIAFVGGGNSDLKSYINLGNGDAYFKGNVGIGTATPSAKLEVSGEIKANGFYGDTFSGGNFYGDDIALGGEIGLKCERVYCEGGDWMECSCPTGKTIMTAGCDAYTSPYHYQRSVPVDADTWECGGHGGNKRIIMYCCPIKHLTGLGVIPFQG